MQNSATTQANLPFWQQLRWRLTLYFVLLTVGVIAIITSVTLLQLRNQSTQQTFRQLESVAQLKQNQISRWLETADLLLHAALSDPNTQTRVLNVLTFPESLPTAQNSLNASLAASVNAIGLQEGATQEQIFEEMFVYDINGRIILSSNRAALNRIVTLQPYFEPSLQDIYITTPYYDVGSNALTAFVTHPIRALNGTVIAALAGRLNMDVLQSIMVERAGLGDTGETYLISNENNYFLTPSRVEGVSLTRAYFSDGINQVLAGTDGSGIYSNYIDTPVLGVYRWIPELGAGLMAEITEAEANALLTQTSLVILGLVGVLTLGAGVLGFLAATNVSRPVVRLTQIARQIASGDLSQRAQIDQRNEIGTLADSFNQMTNQLDDLIGSLEQRVTDRTRDLQAVADVNTQVSTILQLDPLLQEVADLTKARLNLYHSHIYLLNEAGDKLELVAGADEVGRQMVAEKRIISMDNQQSIVANAARNRRGVIINDVTASPTFLPHRLLPNTRSEMAMPLISRGELLGVLDVQSSQKDFFGSEMFAVIELMAGQVATAISNAAAFENVERSQSEVSRRAAELETVAKVSALTTRILDVDEILQTVSDLAKESFDLYHAHIYLLDSNSENLVLAAGAGEIGRVMKSQGRKISYNNTSSLVARAARTRKGVISNNVTREPDFLPNPLLPETQSEMAIPMIIGDQLIGVLDVQSNIINRFTHEDVRVQTTLADQVAVAVQNARAFTQVLLFADTVNNAPIGMNVWRLEDLNDSRSLRLMVANPITETITGIKPETIIGKRFLEAYPTVDPQLLEIYANVVRTGQGVDLGELDFTTDPASPSIIAVNTFPLPNNSVGISFENITQRKLQEREVLELNTRFQDISRTLPGAIFQFTARDGVWSTPYMSEGIYNIIGVTAEAIREDLNRFTERVHPDDLKPYTESIVKVLETLEPWQFEGRAYKPTGEMIWWEAFSQPSRLTSGEIVFNGVLFDITQRKQQEELINSRSMEIQTVAVVGSAIATNLDYEQLLWSVANQTRDNFHRYHVNIYLLDKLGENLSLAAASGEVGRELVANAHQIPLDAPKSLVARAARTRQPVVIQNVSLEPNFLRNKLLPHTQAEMALPIIFDNRVYGVLDIQDNKVNAFDEAHVQAKLILANQIAVAIQNARAFTVTQQRARNAQIRNQVNEILANAVNVQESLEQVMSLMLESLGFDNLVMSNFDHKTQTWYGFAGAGTDITSTLAKTFVDPASAYPHGVEVINTGRVVAIDDVRQYPNFPEYYIETLGIKSVLTLPILSGENVIAVIFGNFNQQMHFFTEEDIELAQQLSEQISFGIERRRQEDEQQLLYLISAQLTNAHTNQEVLEAMSEYGRQRGAAGGTLLAIETENDQATWTEVVATWQDDGSESVTPVGSRFYLPEFPVSKLWLSNPGRPIMINDVLTDERVDPVTRAIYQRTNARGTIIVPLYTQGRWVGLSTFTWPDTVQFNEQDERILNAIMLQVTPTMDALISAQQMQLARAEAETLYQISKLINDAQDEQDLVDAVVAFRQDQAVSAVSLALFENNSFDGAETVTVSADWRSDGTNLFGAVIPLEQFPFLKVLNRHELSLSNDVAADENLDEYSRQSFIALNARSYIFTPLTIGERWLGTLSLSYEQPHVHTQPEIRFMRSVTEQMTSAVERITLAKETQKRAAEIQTVADVSKVAAATLDANKLLTDVSELTKSSFNLYHAHIYLLDEAGENLMLAAGAGEPGRIMRDRGHSISLSQATSLVATAARTEKAVIINDISREPNFLPNPLLPETRAELSVPMIVGDKLIGVLDVQDKIVNRFTETDALVMRTLADQIAVAVENARAFEEQQKTAERLREVDRLKSQFLANMSHELRTPLNSIIGYAEVLLDGIDGELSDDAIEDVEAIHGGGKHLLTIINDILDLAKIEAGQMFIDRRETNVIPVVDEVMNTVKILATNKGIDLNIEIDDDLPTVHGDPIRIKQIILNLMTNSIKFTENGRVTLRMFRHNGGEIAVQVQDTGIGMSENDMKGLFQQFHQVDGSATRRAGGTGLGLVITRHLVHMHEGEIYVESEKGVGSTFWFTIPTYAENVGQRT